MEKRQRPFIKYFIFCITILMAASSLLRKAVAQDFSVTAKPDSTLMVIGGQMDLSFRVLQSPDIQVDFPQFTDTLTENIEIVDKSDLDTTQIREDRIEITQNYRITSFDSGLHHIPPIKFELASEEMETSKETRSIGMRVVNPFKEVDPQEGITDIKSPINTPFKFSELYRFLPWILGGLGIALFIAGAIYFYITRRNPIKALIKEKPREPAHVIALRKLDQVKKEKAWQKGQIKKFHSDLSHILRHYIEDRYDIPAPEQITSQIMNSLRYVDLPDENVAQKAKQVLELADLVKFAKFEPLPDENDLSLMNAYFFVNQTKYEEPKSPEEAAKEINEENNKTEQKVEQ
ncbi:MAG: hypothetical protein ACOCV9_02300 [Marinilabiliaceae bacterium]